MEEQFDKHVYKYDMNNKMIAYKHKHSYRVMALCEIYAKKIGLDEKYIKLAKVIGLLHDYGRFEQVKVYNTYDDHLSIDHADYACDLLFKNNEIKDYWEDESDYELLDFAIRNHNKKEFKKHNIEIYNTMAHLIRDSDKIDILRNIAVKNIEIDIKDTDVVGSKFKENFKSLKLIDYKDVTNGTENYLLKIGFIFDIKFNECLIDVVDILDKIYKELGSKFNEFKEITDKYISGRLKC